jgi:hypothetical protein
MMPMKKGYLFSIIRRALCNGGNHADRGKPHPGVSAFGHSYKSEQMLNKYKKGNQQIAAVSMASPFGLEVLS